MKKLTKKQLEIKQQTKEEYKQKILKLLYEKIVLIDNILNMNNVNIVSCNFLEFHNMEIKKMLLQELICEVQNEN